MIDKDKIQFKNIINNYDMALQYKYYGNVKSS